MKNQVKNNKCISEIDDATLANDATPANDTTPATPATHDGSANAKKPFDLSVYAVTDSKWLNGRSLPAAVEDALRGGATLVQLREKSLTGDALVKLAKEIKEVTDKYDVPLIINDAPEIALACGAAGVHVGQSDMPVEEARKILGPDYIIGVSARTVEQALAAEAGGADYLGVGAAFTTSTKADAKAVSKETVQAICSAVKIPVVVIGGIEAHKISQLTGCGAQGVAIVSAIFSAGDVAEATAEIAAEVKRTFYADCADCSDCGEIENENDAKSEFCAEKIKYKAAIFDCDGTILDSMPMWRTAGSSYLRKQGKVPSADVDARLKVLSLEESAEWFHEEYGVSGTAQEIVDGIMEGVKDNYRYTLQPKPGIVEVLEDLKAHGIRMCIATVTPSEMIKLAMERLGLDKYFEHIYSCSDIGINKQVPDIYYLAQQHLGATVEETLVFEDVIHAIRTAEKAGFPVVAIYDDNSFLNKEEIKEKSILYMDAYAEWPGIEKL